MNIKIILSLIITLFLISCGDDNKKSNNNKDIITISGGEYSFKLEQSLTNLPIWSLPITTKLNKNYRAPDIEKNGITIHLAKNEYEPFLLILGPSTNSKSVKIDIDKFSNLSENQKIEIFIAKYQDDWIEILEKYDQDQFIDIPTQYPLAFWIRVYVPEDGVSGDHQTDINLTFNSGETVKIPLNLYLFNFTIPKEIHFFTQLNVSISNLMSGGKTVEDVKNHLFNLRFTPKSVSWPSGFNWGITWDSSANPDRCINFWDEPTEGEQYSIGYLSKKYILGENWNGVGFPSSMLFQFVNNSTPRPDSFCGESRGDHYGTDSYNIEWGNYLSSLETYLKNNNMIEKGYYYVQNEPQNETDHKLAAYLCSLTKSYAPDLKIAISEEPKPEIAEDSEYGCGYDIWIAHIRSYNETYAKKRQMENGEIVWFYSLDHDPDPYFNPTKIDNSGINQRIIPWVSWRYRVNGWAYYSGDRYFHNGIGGVRAEIFREGFEDYEYLYLANGGYPNWETDSIIDPTVLSVASSLTSWNKDIDSFMELKKALGQYIEGTLDQIPILEVNNSVRERGDYYINFQNIEDIPLDNPLIVDNLEWIKVGWMEYDEQLGYGWYGEYITNSSIAKYGYDDVSGYNEVEKSYLYDDYGRKNLFEFSIPNGKYRVTISAGRPRKGYPNDPHNISIEGVEVLDDYITTDQNPTVQKTIEIDLYDSSLSIEMGGRSELTNNFSYTFLQYLKIEAID